MLELPPREDRDPIHRCRRVGVPLPLGSGIEDAKEATVSDKDPWWETRWYAVMTVVLFVGWAVLTTWAIWSGK